MCHHHCTEITLLDKIFGFPKCQISTRQNPEVEENCLLQLSHLHAPAEEWTAGGGRGSSPPNSCLEHCIHAWGPQHQKDGGLLEQVQRRSTEMIIGLVSTSPM